MFRNKLISIVVMILLLGGVFWWIGSSYLMQKIMGVSRPVSKAANSVGNRVTIITSTLFGVPYSTDEIRKLRAETVALQAQIATLEEARRENALLKEALGRVDEDMHFIYGRVIMRQVSGLDDTILVDVGSDGGAEAGMAVLAPGNIHLGHITEVSNKTSKVRLLSDVGSKTEVYLPESSITSVAEGSGLGLLSVQVPASIDIKEGEPLFTTGKRDLVVGFVEKIEKSDAGPFQIIKTRIPLNIYDIRIVLLVREP